MRNFLLQFFILRSCLCLRLLWAGTHTPSRNAMSYLRSDLTNLSIVGHSDCAAGSLCLLLILVNQHLLGGWVDLVAVRSTSLKLLLELVKLIELLLGGEPTQWFRAHGLTLLLSISTDAKYHVAGLLVGSLLIVQVLLDVGEITSGLRKLLMVMGWLCLVWFLN